jgi:hypothetical protein
MPSEKQLLAILEKDTVDTRSWMVDDLKEAKHQMERAEGRLYSLAIPQADGTLRAWHVTDDPKKVIDLLRDKGDFYARQGDLCGGLYVSGVPHFWEGRSNKKWDFLPKLSREARGTLYQSIYDRLADQYTSGYITPSEFENAEGVMAQAMTTDYWQVLDIVANQPFNIDIPKMAEELAIATPFQPHQVPVDFVGRYLEFNTKSAIEANEALLLLRHGSLEGLTRLDLCNMLKSYGWDGVFTKASMGTNPELVIWSGDKIVAFGNYATGAQLSGPVVTDPEGSRFEGEKDPFTNRDLIIDRYTGMVLTRLGIPDLLELKQVIDRIKAGEVKFTVGRFEANPMFNRPRIIDLRSDTRESLQYLDPFFLGQLEGLVAKLLTDALR